MLVIEAKLPVEIGEVVMKAIDAAVEVLYQDGRRTNRDDEVPAEVPADVPAGTRAAPERRVVVSDNHAEKDNDAYTSPLWQPHEMPGGEAVIEEFEGGSWPGSLGARRADGMRLLAERYLATGAGNVDTSAERYQVVVHIDQALLASESGDPATCAPHPENPSARLSRTCELGEGHALAIETARRLACDASLVGIVDDQNGEPLNVGRKTRAISPAFRRALQARDGGCRCPGCGRTRFTHAHHVIHWARGGETKLENLVTLCTFHHGLVHEGGFSIERTDGGFAFFAPNGERLPESGRLDSWTIARLTDAAEHERVTLHDLNRERGLEIDESTARCRWTGERMDYHMAVGGLIWTRDRAREGVRDRAATH